MHELKTALETSIFNDSKSEAILNRIPVIVMGAPVTPPRVCSSDEYKKITHQEKKPIKFRGNEQKYHHSYKVGFSN